MIKEDQVLLADKCEFDVFFLAYEMHTWVFGRSLLAEYHITEVRKIAK